MEKKVVAITGATKGLGLALAEQLAQKGYYLILGSRNLQELQEIEKEFQKLTKIIIIQMDVTKKADCEAFIKKAEKSFGKLDILINNAGILTRAIIFEQITEKELRDNYETNVFGTFFCSQAAVKVMRKQGYGHIINIGSSAAIDLKTSTIAYGSSKSAVNALTAFLRSELNETAIKVSVINPAGIKTSLFKQQPERKIDNFMAVNYVAKKIIDHLESNSNDWNIIIRKEGE